MKKLYFILALSLLTMTAVEAQTYVNITFRVTVKGTGKKVSADSLRVTGALGSPDQADWSPGVAKGMKLTGTTSDSIYAVTLRVTRPANDTIQYKFINGNNWGDGSGGTTEDERSLTATCAIKANDNRIFKIPAGVTAVTIPAYRFNTCTVVFGTGVNELSSARNVDIYPNPMTSNAVLVFENPNYEAHSLELVNITGQIVRTYAPEKNTQFEIERGNLPTGMYFARMKNAAGESKTVRFTMN